jgi:threonine dehydratase
VSFSPILPSAAEVHAAAKRLAGRVERSPLVLDPALSEIVGGEVHLTLETVQPGGSFKIRGALHALLTLTDAERARGVVATSAGNHGLGVSLAAEALGVVATIFVPATAPAVKREGIAAQGAAVNAEQPDYDAAERAARAHARKTGAVFVSPCTGRSLLAGAGTVALEVLEHLPTLRTIIVPVGGGGLVGGVGGFLREVAAGVRILGAQSVRTNAMSLALDRHGPADIPSQPTLADGLAGLVDQEMFEQGRAALDAIATVEERAIEDAIRWCAAMHDTRVEGAGAVGLAALLTGALKPALFPAVVLVTGENIDRARWQEIVGRA